jgi:ABC-2 type transport system permease protein
VIVGTTVYAVVFGWGGLASRQAIAFGLAYVFLWEFSISGLFAGLRYISVRQYALGTISGLDGDRLQDTVRLDLAPALVGAAIVVLVFGWLTDRRLRLMDIP